MNNNEDVDWLEAERRIQDALQMYENVPIAIHNNKRMSKLQELAGKLRGGKRDIKLYNDIMELTGG